MPQRYVIHTHEVPHRAKMPTRSGVIVTAEKCMGCVTCIKRRCIYGVYKKRGVDPKQMLDSTDTLCKDCFRCVQGCPRELYQKSINPEYSSLGDGYWTPEVITRLWYQAETGRIPVSGAGYAGPFTGPGFDAIWTDMSEIVRPTRDGIHGREYISTAVTIGRKPDRLQWTDDAEPVGPYPPQVELPLPILFQPAPFGYYPEETVLGLIEAARRLGTVAVLPLEMTSKAHLSSTTGAMAPRVRSDQDIEALAHSEVSRAARLVEVVHSGRDSTAGLIARIAETLPEAVPGVYIPLHGETTGEDVSQIVLESVRGGAGAIHLGADIHGQACGPDRREPVFIKDVIRQVHLCLVEHGIRDQVTVLASGGLAMAEHVAKAILCGVDAVVVDLPLLIALGCMVCRRCTRAIPCPADIPGASNEWVAARIVNLIGAWHNQLLEVMGAMGMREVQRLRGEVGRVMFFEELDREIFSSLGRWSEQDHELG